MHSTTGSLAPASPLEEIRAEPPRDVRAGSTRRTADVLVNTLIESGVELAFGLPGGTISPLFDALLDRPEIRVITTRHESGAMFAAAGYARATERLAVVIVTSGPGIMNCMTGLATALCEGFPVLVLAGEVPRALFGRRALQEGSPYHLDVISACRPVTKLADTLPSPDLAPAILRRAILAATTGRRGPVVVTVPLDVSSSPIRVPDLGADMSVDYAIDSSIVVGPVRRAADALASAERPVIFAGSGTRLSGGPEALRELAERLEAPVMTTLKGKGVFPESHRLSLGVFGYGGHPSATDYLEEGVDVLLAVGTGLSDPATDGWSKLLQPSKHFIQIDSDVTQLGRNYPVTIGIAGEAKAVLPRLTDHLAAPMRPRMRYGVRRFTDPRKEEHGPEGRITPQRALCELQWVLPADTLFTCDIGDHLLFATHYLEIDDPECFLTMTGFGSMGSSIAGAVGAHLGQRERSVCAICGDGCFSMALSDIGVATRYRVPLIVAVLNDGRYGMVERGNRAVYGRTPWYSMAPMSVPDLARGLGADCVLIEKAGQILDLDLDPMSHGAPLVLDIRIDRQVKMPMSKGFTAARSLARKKAPLREVPHE
jgi:acetolactate synthase-1/2/3 large subunit